MTTRSAWRRALLHPGIVHEDPDGAMTVLDSHHRGLDRFLVKHVEHDPIDVEAFIAKTANGGVEGFLRSSVQNDMGSRLREPLRKHTSQAPAGTRDKRHFSRQVEKRCRHPATRLNPRQKARA